VNPSKVSCCLVTRGNVDMTEILESVEAAGIRDIVVWNNSIRADLGIYGRYAAISEAKHRVIVTQDDDLIVNDWQAVLDRYQPGQLFCNYPAPWDIPWVARGAIFDREMPMHAFTRYLEHYPFDNDFTHWICDAVFALLTDRVEVEDVGGSRDLPHAFEGDRISLGPGWYDQRRPEAQRRCAKLR
jgi:hypothetical protein